MLRPGRSGTATCRSAPSLSKTGIRTRRGRGKWSCGFYPLHRDQCFRGQALDFETARAGFDAAWNVFLPKRTEAEFEASRREKQWTANKYALWDAGYTAQIRRGEIHCPCGETFNPRFHEQRWPISATSPGEHRARNGLEWCNLCSVTKNQDAIRRLLSFDITAPEFAFNARHFPRFCSPDRAQQG